MSAATELAQATSERRDVVRVLSQELRGKAGEVYNIASGEAVALRTILETFLSFTDVPITVRTDEAKLRKTDIPCLLGDNRKITSEIGWQPEIPLPQTLLDLLEFWRAKD